MMMGFVLPFAFLFLFFSIIVGKINTLKTSVVDRVFLSIFILFSVVPVFMSNYSKTASLNENKALHRVPSLIIQNKINTNFGSDFNYWIDERFYGKDEIAAGLYAVKCVVFGACDLSNMLAGQQGWSFLKTEGSLLNYSNSIPLSEEVMKNNLNYLQKIQKWAESEHKEFYYFIAPDKHRIYGEYFDKVNKICSDELCGMGDVFMKYLRENSNIKAFYPRKFLLQNKNKSLLYWKANTHWNMFGAYLVYKNLMRFMKEPSYHVDEWKKEEKPFSDLRRLKISFFADDGEYKIPADIKNNLCEYKFNYNSVEGFVKCHNPDSLVQKNIFILRDSFMSMLEPYFAMTFKNVEMHFSYDLSDEMKRNIKQNYDIIVFENVERRIPYITH